MIEPLTLTVSAIVGVVFTKAMDVIAEKGTEATLEKLNQLKKKVIEKLRGKPKVQEEIEKIEAGKEADLEMLADYLKIEMRENDEFAKENPRTYLPYVANTLNNLANLHSDKNEMEKVLEEYEEALQIRREIAKENPRTYLPAVAMTLINLSIFYLQSQPNREKSVALAEEVIGIASQFQQVPMVQNYARAAFQVLEANGVIEE